MNHKQSHRHTLTPMLGTLVLTIVSMVCPINLLAAAPDKNVIGVLTGSQGSYRSAVAGLKSAVEAQGLRCVVGELPKTEHASAPVLEQVRSAHPTVVVGVGLAAAQAAAQAFPDRPVLFCMVPNVQDQPLKTGGVTTDIEPKAQVAWLRQLCPSVQKVGVLYSERTRHTLAALTKASQGLELVGVRADKEQFSEALKDLVAQGAEAVLMLPDAAIYNSTNVRALLVWAIRQKKPVFTFSENLVKAGALAGQYAEPAAVGCQTGQWAVQVARGQAKERGLRYPTEVSTAINERTADLIGLAIEETVLNRVTKRYGKDE